MRKVSECLRGVGKEGKDARTTSKEPLGHSFIEVLIKILLEVDPAAFLG